MKFNFVKAARHPPAPKAQKTNSAFISATCAYRIEMTAREVREIQNSCLLNARCDVAFAEAVRGGLT